MKRKTLLIICFCTAACMAVLVILTKRLPNLFSSLLAFPFEQMAEGLSVLSKAGPIGNGLAAAFWIGISSIPAMIACRYGKSKETALERASLYGLSGAILLALYGMVNPSLFRPTPLEGVLEHTKLIKAIFGVSVWAVFVLCVLLCLIRLFRQGSKEQLSRYMQIVLGALCGIFAAIAAVSLVNGSLSLLDSSLTSIDRGFGVLLLAAALTPYLFDIVIIMRVLKLLEMAAGDEQDGVVEAANRVSDSCCLALGLTTAIAAAANILQVVMMRWLSNVTVAADIPIISIAFTVMVLLFARLLIENKKLRDDNHLFI